MVKQKILNLPKPQHDETVSIEASFRRRKTTRIFSDKEVKLEYLSKLLWALQGVMSIEELPNGEKLYHRAAPSSGKTFPLIVYVILPTGLYRYQALEHNLVLINSQDLRMKLSKAAMAESNQKAIKTTSVTIVVTADNQRALTATPIMERAVRYIHLEAGHATQNLLLQSSALGLGVCTVTSFDFSTIYEVLGVPRDHRPIYLLPIGYPKEET